MGLELFDGSNYTLRRESTETQREFAQHEQGQVTAGWEMMVPPPGPDGVPYQFIFVGPTPEHRGSAIRLRLVTTAGGEISDDAEVLLDILQDRCRAHRDLPGEIRAVQGDPRSACPQRRGGSSEAGRGGRGLCYPVRRNGAARW